MKLPALVRSSMPAPPDVYKRQIIYFVLLVGYRTPTGGGDMGLVRCGDTERYRNIAHYAQYTGYGNLCLRCLRNGIDVERCAYKAVTGAVGSRQHIQSAYLFPIVVDSQLEFIFGRVEMCIRDRGRG